MAEPRKRRRSNPETTGPEPKQSAPKTNKRERLFALAEKNYAPRKATRWPYLLRGEQQYRFEGPDRRSLRADLRALWREEHPGEATPPDADLNAVIDDLRARAEKADPDAPTAEDEESQILADHGIGETPADRGLGLVNRGGDCPLPDGYVIPEPYLVTADGIHILKGDGTGPARVACAWLFPVRMYVDPDGDQLVELAWRDGARWVTRLIRRSLTKSGRKLIAEAGDAGLPVIEADARQAERWLAAAEAANRGVIARHPVARQLGWQADGKTFVTAQDSPWRIEPRYSDQAAALAAHRAQGTLAAWQEAVRGIEEYIVVRAGLYAGLAAPLLLPLDLDSFTVDFAGKSGRGKTITAMVALSCWADPSDRADGMFTWQSASQIGVEKRLNLLNGLVAVIDETRLVKDPALVDTVLYMVPKNHGAPRGGGWPNMIPWRPPRSSIMSLLTIVFRIGCMARSKKVAASPRKAAAIMARSRFASGACREFSNTATSRSIRKIRTFCMAPSSRVPIKRSARLRTSRPNRSAAVNIATIARYRWFSLRSIRKRCTLPRMFYSRPPIEGIIGRSSVRT